MEGIKLSPQQQDVKPNYAYFPVVFDEKVFGATRNEVAHHLAEHDIMARKYFYPLVNDFDCYRSQYSSKDTPVALSIAKRVLTLPLYAELGLDEVDEICRLVLELHSSRQCR